MPYDWLVPMDDLLTARQDHCSDCGAVVPTPWVGLVDLDCGLSVAYAVCPTCKAKGTAGAQALNAKLETRYGKERTP